MTERHLIETLLDALCTALPFVEDAETDPCYRLGGVRKRLLHIRSVIAMAEQFLSDTKEDTTHD